MFTRRVILLFILFTLGFAGLALRLAMFQIAQADQWAAQATRFVQRHYLIDTRRGTIFDARGRPLARDEPALDVVMDFQAMNLDDAWITQCARKRMTDQGITTREERLRRLPDFKAEIADQIAEVPAVIVHQFDLARHGTEQGASSQPHESIPALTANDIEYRVNLARERIHRLKQDQWLRRYDKNDAPGDTEPDAADDAPITPVAEEMQAQVIVEDIPLTVKIALDQLRDILPGVEVVQSKRRKYAYNDVAAHVIGTTQAVTQEQVAARQFARPDLLSGETGDLHGYLPGDKRGSFGMESYCEDILRGTRGVGLRELGGADIPEKHINSQAGRDVQLTLDIELQKAIQNDLYANDHVLLKGQDPEDHTDHNVAIVVMRISDRAILAMLSTPTYDLNTYQKNIAALNSDEANKPLLNRAMLNFYPPGSTVKPLVAAAALTENTLVATVNCKGALYDTNRSIFRCNVAAGHGLLNLRQALERSCNVYFYTQGREMGLEKMADWYTRFGFGAITGIGPGEKDGNVPDPASFHNAELMRSEATQLGIGQGSLAVTPLQMANAYATLLQGGMMQAPTLVAGEQKTPRRVFDITPEHLQQIKDGMQDVVHGDSGTARKEMRGFGLPVAGKTGSAETEPRLVFDENGNRVYRVQLDADEKPVLGPDGKPQLVYRRDTKGDLILDANGQPIPLQDRKAGTDSWFAGYAPYQDPQYVVVAVKEFGGHGGITAVPVVRAAFLEMEKQGYLPNVDAR